MMYNMINIHCRVILIKDPRKRRGRGSTVNRRKHTDSVSGNYSDPEQLPGNTTFLGRHTSVRITFYVAHLKSRINTNQSHPPTPTLLRFEIQC